MSLPTSRVFMGSRNEHAFVNGVISKRLRNAVWDMQLRVINNFEFFKFNFYLFKNCKKIQKNKNFQNKVFVDHLVPLKMLCAKFCGRK